MGGVTHRRTAAAAACLLCGCYTSAFTTEPDPSGSAHASIVSIIPWEEIKDKLQPNFVLQTGEEAMQKVAPVVEAQNDAFTRNLGFSLGAMVGATFSDAGAINVSSSAATFANWPDGGLSPRVSPITQYNLAAVLYQEVKLLNEALSFYKPPAGYEGYLIAANVTLIPRRDADFDANVVLSFTAEPESEHARARARQIEVIPILSQDDLELTQHTRTLDNIVQLAFALSIFGKFQQTPIQILSAFGLREEEVRSTLGRDINTLQVVASAGRSALIAHFGAAQTVSPPHTLFPQTRRVYAMLLVPQAIAEENAHGRGRLKLMTTVDFIDAAGRVRMDRRFDRALRDELEDVCWGRVRPKKEDAYEIWLKYQTAAPTDDIIEAALAACQIAKLPAESNPPELMKLTPDRGMSREQRQVSNIRGYRISDWERMQTEIQFVLHNLNRLDAAGQYRSSAFWLPPPVADRLDAPAFGYEAAVNESTLSVTVRGQHLSAARDRWSLVPAIDKPAVIPILSNTSPSLVTLTVPADSFCDGGSCRGLIRYELRRPPDAGQLEKLQQQQLSLFATAAELERAGVDVEGQKSAEVAFSARQRPQKPSGEKPPEATLTVANEPIAAEADGTGVAVVEVTLPSVSKATQTLSIHVSGGSAVIAGADGGTAPAFQATIDKDKKSGRVVVPLRWLIPGQTLQFDGRDSNGARAGQGHAVVVRREGAK